MIGRTARAVAFGLAGFSLVAGALPASAQDADAAARLRKLEAEVRALQRKVFPGEDGKYFEPQITGQSASPTAAQPVSTSALTDVLARLDALENQLRTLTAQYEEGSNAVRLLSDRVARLEGGAVSGSTREPATTTTTTLTPVVTPAGPGGTPAAAAPIAVTTTTTTTAPAAERPASPKPAAAKPAGPNAARLAAVQAILKPQSDDAGEDEYSYGYRLWDAKLYPEAQQQLTMFLEKYPKHKRVSFARNLLGRAYLDDGKPKEAAPWFLKNYQADKMGERAGDSLLYLAETMIALKDTKRACIALAEFSESYPALAGGRLASQYDADRAKVKCN